MTIIGFVGSVFSPYYFRSRRKSESDPLEFCAINVALYGGVKRWAMTERGKRHVSRSADHFSVGPSSMRWNEEGLTIAVRELCSPLPYSLCGEVKFTPGTLYDEPVLLDAKGRHRWRAVAPTGRIAVALQRPQLSWSGTAYHDMNWGDEPLESAFADWTWLRAGQGPATTVLYQINRRDGTRHSFGKTFEGGRISDHAIPQEHQLQAGLWGMRRPVLSESTPILKQKLEDAPFYTRNHVGIELDSKPCDAVHESLSLDRFVNPIVQRMLPFRMPRAT